MRNFIKVTILFLCVNIIFTTINGQELPKDELFEFYPYNEGNNWLYNWIYINQILEYAEAGYDKVESTNDTLINNKSYWIMKYYYKNYNSCETYYEGIDTATGDVMRLDENSSFEPRCIDNIYAQVGDTISIVDNPNLLYCDRLVVTGIYDTLLNNYSTTIREVVGIPSQQKLFFAKGIGFLGSNEYYWLDSAVVDGNIFNNVSSDISAIDESQPVITDFTLYQNYPNPFNPTTNIKYTIANSGIVKLMIYDLLGRKVECIVDEYQSNGNYIVEFNASNLPSGVYLYSLTCGKYTETKKLVLLK